MPNTVTQSFIDLWNDEVHQVYQQEGSKLRQACRVVTGVVGSRHQFHKIGSVVAQQGKTRHLDFTSLDPSHDTPVATLQDFYAPIYIDRLDEVKTNADLRREYVYTSANAIGRAMDDEIIVNGLEAAVTGSPAASQVDATTGSGLTLARVLEAKRELDLADVPKEGRFFIISPNALEELLQNTEVTSRDFQNVKALVQGDLDYAFGFNWITSTRLTKTGGSPDDRRCFAYHRDAVGCAVGFDLTTEVNYIPEKTTYLVNTMLSIGSVNIDSTGIVEVLTADTEADNNSLT